MALPKRRPRPSNYSSVARHMSTFKRGFLVLFITSVTAAVFLMAAYPTNTPRTFLNHHRAVASLQSLNFAERAYAHRHPADGFACNLNNLAEQGAIDRVLATGTKAAYIFEIGCPAREAQANTAYTLTAVPTVPGKTGIYALCSDQSGEIWYSANGSASECLAERKPVAHNYK